ncbi:universal stress protein [Streptomyces sp. VRA16 Mangrove soil]|uniref:universal stress protein n=1 Tax=Streptomyces sp. VRA16 Mangrove soil TaxID=2817434 RepID=UPI001A9E313D|nr:universal stress protein [Streptomyces sp. VRA16 Mangrove soil]MBO1334529.1 universal stress protein [Streptomyces sp. VRA16 Mangrove soil]
MGQERVVVAVDGTGSGRAAAGWAAREALWRGVPVHAVRVRRTEPSGRARADRAVVESVRRLAAAHHELTVTLVDVIGAPVPALLAQLTPESWLVLGTDGTGGAADTLAADVAGRAGCPVALVPGGILPAADAGRTDRIAVGVDVHSPDGAALGLAFDRAQRTGARLRAVHAWAYPEPEASAWPFAIPEADRARWEDQEVQRVCDALHPWREKYPRVPLLLDVVRFAPAQALIRASHHTDLLVVGRRDSRLGVTVRALMRAARGPVVLVPH